MHRLGTEIVLSIFIIVLLLMIIFSSLLLLVVCHYIITEGEKFKGRQAVSCLDIARTTSSKEIVNSSDLNIFLFGWNSILRKVRKYDSIDM